MVQPDIYPAVTIDRRLGELIENFEVDFATLTTLMRDRGFSDEQIQKTNIEIRNEILRSEYTQDPDRPLFVHGGYNPKTENIYVFPRPSLEQGGETPKDIEAHEFITAIMTAIVSNNTSKYLVHELEHHAENILEAETRADDAMPVGMGGSALRIVTVTSVVGENSEESPAAPQHDSGSEKTAYEEYFDSPEEVRCREAQENAPANLIRIRPRYVLIQKS